MKTIKQTRLVVTEKLTFFWLKVCVELQLVSKAIADKHLLWWFNLNTAYSFWLVQMCGAATRLDNWFSLEIIWFLPP